MKHVIGGMVSARALFDELVTITFSLFFVSVCFHGHIKKW